MPKKEDEELSRVHVLLFSEDVDKIHSLFGDTIGFSKAVRSMVRNFLRHLENQAAESAKPVKPSDFEL